jgi:hypothetical protein
VSVAILAGRCVAALLLFLGLGCGGHATRHGAPAGTVRRTRRVVDRARGRRFGRSAGFSGQ